MRASSAPDLTVSPVSAPSSRISPEAFDLISTVCTGSITPAASTVSTSGRFSTVAVSYCCAAAGWPRWPQAATSIVISATAGIRRFMRLGSWVPGCRPRSCRRASGARGSARAATPASCVTTMRLLPARWMSSKSARISSPVAVSRLPVGSSASSRLGLVTSARAMATRCRWPPESSAGRCLDLPVEPDPLERLGGAAQPLAPRDMGVDERQLDILQRRRARQQRERLEDEADGAVAHLRELAVAQVRHELPVQPVAAAVGGVEATDDVHQRGLAAARRSHDRGVIAAADHQVDAPQRLDGLAAHAIAAGDVLGADQFGFGHGLPIRHASVERWHAPSTQRQEPDSGTVPVQRVERGHVPWNGTVP